MSSLGKSKVFLPEKHIEYIKSLDTKEKDTFEFHVTEHLRMSGLYWGLTCLYLLSPQELENLDKKEEIIQFILHCQDLETGGFGGNLGHDAHILYTLSAIQVLALFKSYHRLSNDRISKILKFIKSLQQLDGSFVGDLFAGEIDTRFSYCAISCLKLLQNYVLENKIQLDENSTNLDIMVDDVVINFKTALDFVLKCRNFDEGFGAVPGAESHSGQVFCCCGVLSILQKMDVIDQDTLAWWLAERQLESGGFNGRPEKKPCVCYSWWVLSALGMMNRLDWISKSKLKTFIIACQNSENGGIADKPVENHIVDAFHTFFGVAGLSLIEEPGLAAVDPTYALPVEILKNYCKIQI